MLGDSEINFKILTEEEKINRRSDEDIEGKPKIARRLKVYNLSGLRRIFQPEAQLSCLILFSWFP
jgi:hypothetical protein